jgi:hypothetical protein
MKRYTKKKVAKKVPVPEPPVVALWSPTGVRIRGILESVQGVALAGCAQSIKGRWEPVYEDETDLDWDSQAPVRGADGRRIWVDENGDTWGEDQLRRSKPRKKREMSNLEIVNQLLGRKPGKKRVVSNAEMVKRGPRTALVALEKSIAVWEERKKPDKPCDVLFPDATTCPLCDVFVNSHQSCEGCPVMELTGKELCVCSPYSKARTALQNWMNSPDDELAKHLFRGRVGEEVRFLNKAWKAYSKKHNL